MKKGQCCVRYGVLVTFITLILLVSVLSLGLISAQEEDIETEVDSEVELPEPGILPGSAFYGVKTAWERVQFTFTVGDERKSERALRIAEKRLAELNALAEEDEELSEETLERMERSIEQYEAYVERAEERRKEVSAENEEEFRKMAEHQRRIESFSEKTNEVHIRILTRMAEMEHPQTERVAENFERVSERISEAERVSNQRRENSAQQLEERGVVERNQREEIEREVLDESRENRAQREIQRAQETVEEIEAKFESYDIDEEETLDGMKGMIEEAREKFNEGRYSEAFETASEAREFGIDVSRQAISLRQAQEEGRLDEAVSQLREFARERGVTEEDIDAARERAEEIPEERIEDRETLTQELQ